MVFDCRKVSYYVKTIIILFQFCHFSYKLGKTFCEKIKIESQVNMKEGIKLSHKIYGSTFIKRKLKKRKRIKYKLTKKKIFKVDGKSDERRLKSFELIGVGWYCLDSFKNSVHYRLPTNNSGLYLIFSFQPEG